MSGIHWYIAIAIQHSATFDLNAYDLLHWTFLYSVSCYCWFPSIKLHHNFIHLFRLLLCTQEIRWWPSPTLLCNGTPSRHDTFIVSFMPWFSIFGLDISLLIWRLLNLSFHNHHCYRYTFLPHRMWIRYFNITVMGINFPGATPSIVLVASYYK